MRRSLPFDFPAGLVVGFLCFTPGNSDAMTYLWGPVEGNSWTFAGRQLENELWLGNLVGPYDYIRADWVSGSTFEAPLFQSMTNGWASGPSGQTSTFAWATGPSANVNMTLFFNDPLQITTFNYFVYDGATLKQAQQLTISDGILRGIDLSADSGPGRVEPVPEPGTLLLVGLAVLGATRGNRRKRRRG